MSLGFDSGNPVNVVGPQTQLFHASFEAGAVHRSQMLVATTTMSVGVASGPPVGTIALNDNLTTNVGTFATMASHAYFPIFATGYRLTGTFHVGTFNDTEPNTASEWGFATAASSLNLIGPADGVFFRMSATASGVRTLQGVLALSTTETVVAIVGPDGVPPVTEMHRYSIEIGRRVIRFMIDDRPAASILVPLTQSMAMQQSSASAFVRVYTSTGVGSTIARQLYLGYIGVHVSGGQLGLPWAHAANIGGAASYQTQPGTTSGPTVNRTGGTAGTPGWPVSATARAAGTWTATSAPAVASLGGLWLSPAISTLTSDADYPVFDYQNPPSVATRPARNLVITGVVVGNTCVTTVGAVNSIVLAYILGVGSTSSGTAGTESATVLATRAIPIGQVAFPIGAALGTFCNGWAVDFSASPIVIPPTSHVQFIVRPFGTVASNTMVVAGSVGFIGYHA